MTPWLNTSRPTPLPTHPHPFKCRRFSSTLWTCWDVRFAAMQRTEEGDGDLFFWQWHIRWIHLYLLRSGEQNAHSKYSCANSECNHSSAAWLCECHPTLPVELYAVGFGVWFGTKVMEGESNRQRFIFTFISFCFIVLLRHSWWQDSLTLVFLWNESHIYTYIFLHPFNNIPSFLCLYCSISCWVLYNLGVLRGAVSGIAMAQPPTLLLLIEMDWGEASLSSLSPLTHTSLVNTHATLVWVLSIWSWFVLLSFIVPFPLSNTGHPFPLRSHHFPFIWYPVCSPSQFAWLQSQNGFNAPL